MLLDLLSFNAHGRFKETGLRLKVKQMEDSHITGEVYVCVCVCQATKRREGLDFK